MANFSTLVQTNISMRISVNEMELLNERIRNIQKKEKDRTMWTSAGCRNGTFK